VTLDLSSSAWAMGKGSAWQIINKLTQGRWREPFISLDRRL